MRFHRIVRFFGNPEVDFFASRINAKCDLYCLTDKATGILVVPKWTAQPWYPLFLFSLVGKPIEFRPSKVLLLSPCRSVVHSLAHQTILVAGVLSGKPTLGGDTQQSLQRSCYSRL